MYLWCFRLSCDECDAVWWICSHFRDNRTKQLRNEWHLGRHHKRHHIFDDTVGNDSDDEDVNDSECDISEVDSGCGNVEQDLFDWGELEDDGGHNYTHAQNQFLR
jgi:hypothetical protein